MPDSERGDEQEGRPDDGLLARLHAAGRHEREQTAPAHLQGRLERAYAARRIRPMIAGLPMPGHWAGLAAACAVAACIAIAVLWRPLAPGGFAPEHAVADTQRGAQVANDRAAPPGGSSGASAPAPRQPSLAGGPSPRTTAAAHTDTGRAISRSTPSAAAAHLTEPTQPPGSAPVLAAMGAVAANADRSTADARRLPALPTEPIQGLPDLRLDPSALRIVTTAPMLPSLPLQAPTFNGPSAIPAGSPPSGMRDGTEDEPAPAAGATLPTTRATATGAAQRIA